MANSTKISVDIEVTGDGKLRITANNMDKVAKSADKATKAANSLGTAQEHAAEGTLKHTRAQNGGVASANNSARSASKLLETVGSSNSGLVAAYASLAVNAFAVSAAFNTLSSAAKAEQLLAGLEKQGARTGQTLTVTAKNMKELSGNAISMAESMQSAAQMSAAGFSTTTMERLTKVATDAAAALGRSVPDAMERVVKGTSKLEPELLDELGIMTKLDEATRLYATQIGKAPTQLSRFERSQAFVNAVAAEGERKFAGLSDSMGNLKGYDTLAAAFTDLTNATLGFLNAGLLPIVNFLANNSTVLLGVLVMFAGTIRNSMLPALAELAENTSKAAEASKKAAIAKKASIEVHMKEAKATAEAAAATARSFQINEKAPAVLKKKAKAILEGSAVTKDYSDAYTSLNRSLKLYETNIETGLYKDEETLRQKQELVAELKTLKTTLESVQEADRKVADEAVANSLKVRNAKKAEKAAILDATAKEGQAAVVSSATEGDFVGAFAKLNESVAEYKAKSEELAEKKTFSVMFSDMKESAIGVIGSFKGIIKSVRDVRASSGILVAFRTGLLGVAGAARITGIALTNMIPIIGQIITVVGLLWSAISWIWEWSKPEGSEALEKALEDQEERYKSTAKAAEELKRQGMETASAQISSLTTVSNKVNELVEGYQAIKDAEANLGKPAKDVSKPLDNRFNLDKLGLESGLTDSAEFKTLQNMQTLGFESLTESIYKQVLAQNTLKDSSVDLETKKKILSETIKASQKSFGDAGTNAKALSDSYTQLDKVTEEFNRTAVTSTPFDGLVKSLTETTSNIYQLEASMYRGAISSKDFGIQLTALSDRAAGNLDISVQDKLEEVKSLQAELAKLQIELEKGTITAQGTARLQELQGTEKIEGRLTTLLKIAGAEIAENLSKRRQETAELQNQLRVNASLTAAVAARAQVSARVLEDSKLAARIQDQANEAQVKLAVAALDAQIKFTTNQKRSAEREKERLLANLTENRRLQEEQEKANKKAEKDRAEATKKQLKGLNTVKNVYRNLVEMTALVAILQEKIEEKASKILQGAAKQVEEQVKALKDSDVFGGLFEEVKDTSIDVEIDVQSGKNKLQELIAQQRELQAKILENSAVLSDFNSQLTALESSKVVELSKVLSEAEKAGRDLGYDTQLLNEFLGKRLELESAIIDASILAQNINRNSLNGFEKQLQIKQRELNVELRRIDTQKEQERRTLQTQKTAKTLLIQQGQLDSATKRAAQFDLSVIEARLTAIDIEKRTLSEVAKFKYSIQNVEAATVDIYKEGLEIQQRSLEVVQKRLALQEQLASQMLELESIQADTKSAQTGVEQSERAKKASELRSAKVAIDVAKSQLEIKLQGIKLEYELLEAQRLATINEFKLRQHILGMYVKQQLTEAATKRASGTQEGIRAASAIESSMADINVMMGQFGSSIQELQKYSFRDMIPMAMEVEKNAVKILEARYEQLRAEFNNIGRPVTSADIFRQAVNDMSTIINERSNRNTTMEIPTSSAPIVKNPAIEAERSSASATTLLSSTISTYFPELISGLDSLDKAFESLVGGLSKDLKKASAESRDTIGKITGRSEDTMAKTMKIAMGMATKAGGKFWQYGAQTGHDGEGHKEYRAIDVYMAPGNKESTDPKIRKKMDALAEDYALKGYVVLWNKVRLELNKSGEIIRTAIEKGANQHTDHMHVEALRAGVILRESMSSGGEAASKAIKEASISPVESIIATPPSTYLAPATPSASLAPTNETPTLDLASVTLDPSIKQSIVDIGKLIADLPVAGLSKKLEVLKVKFSDVWQFATATSKPLLDLLETLGPSGQANAAAIQGMQAIGQSIISFSSQSSENFKEYEARMTAYNTKLAETGQKQVDVANEGEFAAQRMAQGFSMAAAVIGSVMGVLKASSDAKIAGIDKEIAAEEKRDGKSAASVAKLQALDKKKDSMARKAFNTNKKLMMAQAVMATAAGIAGVLGDPSLPTLAKPIFAGIIGAMGLAQIAVIAGTQFESASASRGASMPSTLSVGKRSDTVDLARGPNANAGGEVGFLRGSSGSGSNAGNYNTVGSAYGGELMRGYGNRGFVVGEKGPEIITPETPISVTPTNEMQSQQPLNATFNIQALDSSGVQDLLVAQKGNIIKMLREAANASGTSFMEEVNVNVYTRPNVAKL